MDDKYNILHHPNVSLSADGGAKPYIHGTTERAEASITLGTLQDDAPDSITLPDGIDLLGLELLSEEEECTSCQHKGKQADVFVIGLTVGLAGTGVFLVVGEKSGFGLCRLAGGLFSGLLCGDCFRMVVHRFTSVRLSL